MRAKRPARNLRPLPRGRSRLCRAREPHRPSMPSPRRFSPRHLGGRAEPIGNDFTAAEFRVPEGAAAVPGLAAALTMTASGEEARARRARVAAAPARKQERAAAGVCLPHARHRAVARWLTVHYNRWTLTSRCRRGSCVREGGGAMESIQPRPRSGPYWRAAWALPRLCGDAARQVRIPTGASCWRQPAIPTISSWPKPTVRNWSATACAWNSGTWKVLPPSRPLVDDKSEINAGFVKGGLVGSMQGRLATEKAKGRGTSSTPSCNRSDVCFTNRFGCSRAPIRRCKASGTSTANASCSAPATAVRGCMCDPAPARQRD